MMLYVLDDAVVVLLNERMQHAMVCGCEGCGNLNVNGLTRSRDWWFVGQRCLPGIVEQSGAGALLVHVCFGTMKGHGKSQIYEELGGNGEQHGLVQRKG
jgi:hypothetical protein